MHNNLSDREAIKIYKKNYKINKPKATRASCTFVP